MGSYTEVLVGKDKKKPDKKRKKKLTRKEMKERDKPLSLFGEDPDDVLGKLLGVEDENGENDKNHNFEDN